MSTLINEIVYSSFEIVNESHNDKKASITSSRSKVMVPNEIIQMSCAYHLVHHLNSFHSIPAHFDIATRMAHSQFSFFSISSAFCPRLCRCLHSNCSFFPQYILLQLTIKWMLFIAHWSDLFSTAIQHGWCVPALYLPGVEWGAQINFLTQVFAYRNTNSWFYCIYRIVLYRYGVLNVQ